MSTPALTQLDVQTAGWVPGFYLSFPRREITGGCPEWVELSSNLITLSGVRSCFLITAMLYCPAQNMTADDSDVM